MKRITITEASKMLNVSEQCTRMMIQSGQIENKEKKDVMQQRLYKLRERILYKRIF